MTQLCIINRSIAGWQVVSERGALYMSKSNVDPIEINKFSTNAAHWWDTAGQYKSLHDINPLRLGYIQERAALGQKRVLDVGCGGGILSESMAKRGAIVTGIDMSNAALQVAELHALESQVSLDYQATTAEDFAEQHPESFDVVTCLEMLEHVPDPAAIIKACSRLCKPGGHVFFSTLNRNLKSYLFAIVGAEYVLKLIPQNTHDYEKFIRPSELIAWGEAADLDVKDTTGLHYHLLRKTYFLSPDVSVNYLVHFQKK